MRFLYYVGLFALVVACVSAQIVSYNETSIQVMMAQKVSITPNQPNSNSVYGWVSGGANAQSNHVDDQPQPMVTQAISFTNSGSIFSSFRVTTPMTIGLTVSSKTMKQGVIGGLSIGSSSVCYVEDGVSCLKSKTNWNFLEEINDSYYIPSMDAYVLVGVFDYINQQDISGIAWSYDQGKTFNYTSIGACPMGSWARFGAFPTPTTYYVTAAIWPGVGEVEKNGYYPYSPSIHIPVSEKTKPDGVKYGPASHHFKVDNVEDPTGYNTYVYKTEDAGQTWNIVYTTDQYAANRISCPSENVCFFVAENEELGSVVMRTQDGGKTWAQVANVPTQTDWIVFQAMTCTSETTCWAGGAMLNPIGEFDGIILYTADGGNTWHRRNFQDWFFQDFGFVTPNHGFFAATANGGYGTLVEMKKN